MLLFVVLINIHVDEDKNKYLPNPPVHECWKGNMFLPFPPTKDGLWIRMDTTDRSSNFLLKVESVRPFGNANQAVVQGIRIGRTVDPDLFSAHGEIYARATYEDGKKLDSLIAFLKLNGWERHDGNYTFVLEEITSSAELFPRR